MSPRRAKGFAQPIDLTEFKRGARHDLELPVYENSLGHSTFCPFVLIHGARPGPVMGVCAATHGDELNGIYIIHRLLSEIDAKDLTGSVLCCPVVNVPAFEMGQRRFPDDDKDLNSCFPGRRTGTPSQQYANAFVERFLRSVDYLVDIHTASEGRLNSLYVRADWNSAAARHMAELLEPQIILHGQSGDKTLRSAARRLDIPAVTLEAGNPSVFQEYMAEAGQMGILRVMQTLGMISESRAIETKRTPVLCESSQWLRTTRGGILLLDFELCQVVKKGQVLARLKNAFGKITDTYRAPHDGIVIGMGHTPLSVPGTRYCHLGKIGTPAPPKTPVTGRMASLLGE